MASQVRAQSRTQHAPGGRFRLLCAAAAACACLAALADPTQETLVARGSSWRYLDNGSDQHTAWRTHTFNDAAWPTGLAQFGYGDGDETTVVSYGTNSNWKHVTTYFRTRFVIADPSRYKTLNLSVLRDDGAAVYLNGTRVLLNNLATLYWYSSLATSSIEGDNETNYVTKVLSPSILQTGTNVLAAEVHIHNRSTNDNDMSFDAELTGTPFASNLVRLTVQSVYGSPSPPVGTNLFDYGDSVTCTMGSPVQSLGSGTQAVCVGWTGVGIPSGTGTTGVVVLTNDATLVWQWRTNVWLEGPPGAGGWVYGADRWLRIGGTAQVEAVACGHYRLDRWAGDVPAHQTGATPLPLVMDRARSVAAVFGVRTNTNGLMDLPYVSFQTTGGAGQFALATNRALLGTYQENMSGCCLKPDTGELLVVLNRTTPTDLPAVQVYATNGVYRRSIATVGFDDVESICQYRPESNLFALLEEGRSDISIVEIRTNTTSLSKSVATVIHMGVPYSGNTASEGLTYDRTNDCFYVVKEKNPMAVYRVYSSNGTYRSETLFNAQTVFNGLCTDLSDVYYEPERGHLWILSQEGNRIFECDLSGRVIDTLPVPGANQPEGLTLTPDRQTLYVVGEPNEYFRYTRRPDHVVCAEGSNLDFTAVLSWPWTNTVTMEWNGFDSQATPWRDFTPATGLVSFAAGATSALLHVLVPIDMETEREEGFALRLTNGVNASIGDDPRSTIAIAANTSVALVVVSPFGIAAPPVGTNLFNVGMRTNCEVTGSPLYAGVLATQYVCNGWIGSGSIPTQGLTTATPRVVLTTNSAIRWVWHTNAYLAFTVHGSGTVSAANGWYRLGTGIVAEASAQTYHHFTQWGGDLPSGSDATNSTLPIAVDRQRLLTAGFGANLATLGTPEWWLAGIYGDTNDFDGLELADTDGDGHAAWQEHRAGTDPTNAASVLRIASIRRLAGGMQINWPGVTGRAYRVYRQSALATGGNVDIVASGIPGSTTGIVTDTAATGITGAFYRVVVE